MADDIFEHPRLAAVYDDLDPDRSDLEVYAAIVSELGARVVLDLGCGTGTFALMLAEQGVAVVGLDPAGASLDVARRKAGSEEVRWVHGDATAVPEDLAGSVDLAVMTGNVAQAIVDEEDWSATLARVRRCLRPGGHLVLETRRPEARGWQEWTREASEVVTEVPGHGSVRHWVELTAVDLPLVSFESHHVFTDETLVSTSTLSFRTEAEVTSSLVAAGYEVDEVREAPDRPGRELVFLATRAPLWTTRPATANDLAEMLRLADARRRQYADYQPVFWRPAPDAVERQRPHFSSLIDDETVLSVVADAGHGLAGFAIGLVVAAPPVYDPGGTTCVVDDFTVDDPRQWSTVGVDLLRTVRRLALDRGATQVVVVSGHLDGPKRAALEQDGLSIASEWWVAPLEGT